MELHEVAFDSDGYREALALRARILREPLGVEWTVEEVAAEPRDRHFAVFDEGRLIACVTARELGGGRIKLRQMAVTPERQRTGTGRWLLERVEAVLRGEGACGFELNAREVARGFYEKLGYAVVGERFTEVGVPHWKMWKGRD